MALLDKVKNMLHRPAAPLTEQEAIASLVSAAVKADGKIDSSEILLVLKVFENKKLFAATDTTGLFRQASLRNKKIGSQQLVIQTVAPIISEKLRPTLFAIVLDLVLADGIITNTEEQLIKDLQQAFGLDDRVTNNMVDTLLVKNKPF